MPIVLRPISQDELFENTKLDKLILNDLSLTDIGDADLLEAALATVYDDQEIELRPSCACGATKGFYTLSSICEVCNGEVVEAFETFNNTLWIKALGDMRFITVDFWTRVSYLITPSTFDPLRWIADKYYNPATAIKINSLLIPIKAMDGFERTYQFLYNNLDKLLILVGTLNKKDKGVKILLDLWVNKRELVTTEHMPLLSSKYFITEKTEKGKIVNVLRGKALEPTKSFLGGCNLENNTPNEEGRLMGKLIAGMATYYKSELSATYGSKTGVIRKNLFGTRVQFTARAVIVPFIGEHNINHLHIPYKVGVVLLRPMILNRLLKLGYTPKAVSKRLWESINFFDEELYDIMMELISESKEGLPILLTRNPSQKQGSTLRLDITSVKRDYLNTSFSVSILNCTKQNADFDGDELHLILLGDQYLADLTEVLRPYRSAPDDGNSFTISRHVNVSGAAANISNHLLKTTKKKGDVSTLPKDLLI